MTPRPIHPALRPALATRLTRHGLTPDEADAHLTAYETGQPASPELAAAITAAAEDVIAAVRPHLDALARNVAAAAHRIHAVHVQPFRDWLPDAAAALNQRAAADIAGIFGRTQ